MKLFLFFVLLTGIMTVAQAEEQQCHNEVSANVHGNRVLLAFRGQSAKDIFNAMPKSSKLSPKESCYTDATIKVKGGFVCDFNPDSINPNCAYLCDLEVSAETGKVSKRDRNNMCEDEL